MEPPLPLRLSRIARKYLYPNATVTLADGTKIDPSNVHAVLILGRGTPTGDTEWIEVPLSPQGRRILVAGPDADPTDAVVIPPGGADLWIRVVDEPEVDVTESRRIEIY
jgi:hypothetical protein